MHAPAGNAFFMPGYQKTKPVPITAPSSAAPDFEAKLWLAADKLRTALCQVEATTADR
jgi:hypothetical protein